MGFVSGFKKILGIVGPIGVGYASTKYPEFGPLINVGWSAVQTVADEIPAAAPAEMKRNRWMDLVTEGIAEIITDIEDSTGKVLVDEAKFAVGLAQLRDAQVNILKAFQKPSVE